MWFPVLNDSDDHINLLEQLTKKIYLKMNVYLTFKALHLIAVISWMAGLLYLPRIFVYHAETKENKGQSETFKLNGEKTIFLHNEPRNDFILGFWYFTHLRSRYFKPRIFVDEN